MDIFSKRVIKTDDYSEKIAAYHNRTEEFQQVSYLRLFVENIYFIRKSVHALSSQQKGYQLRSQTFFHKLVFTKFLSKM